MFTNNAFNKFNNNMNNPSSSGNSLIGNTSNLFANRTNNVNGSGNEDMSISPVRSPNIQPKINLNSKCYFFL